jgi:outer membrane biosynthesis protein TonB
MATATPSLPFSTPGADAAPAYRVITPLILVKDAAGLLHYKYHGSMIPWLSPEQEAHFLELKMIEKVSFNQPEPDVEPEPVEPEPVDLDAATTQDDSTDDEFVVDPEPESKPAPRGRQQRSK